MVRVIVANNIVAREYVIDVAAFPVDDEVTEIPDDVDGDPVDEEMSNELFMTMPVKLTNPMVDGTAKLHAAATAVGFDTLILDFHKSAQ